MSGESSTLQLNIKGLVSEIGKVLTNDEDVIGLVSLLTEFYNTKAHQPFNGIEVVVGDLGVLISNAPNSTFKSRLDKLGLTEITQICAIYKKDCPKSEVILKSVSHFHGGKYYVRFTNIKSNHISEYFILATNMTEKEIASLKTTLFMAGGITDKKIVTGITNFVDNPTREAYSINNLN